MGSETSASSRADRPHTARTFSWGIPEIAGARGAEHASGGTRFDRSELKRILSTYFRMVVAGEWRDYAIDFRDDAAIFSVFRRASECPIYTIEKRPRLKDRQGQYAVIAPGGLVIGRGNDLSVVLRTLERKLLRSVQDAE